MWDVSDWRRCGQCRKVKTSQEYDGGGTICTPCLAGPPATRVKAAVVTRRASMAKASVAEPVPRHPRLGTVGNGDLEVRERRAKRAAQEGLIDLYPEEYEQLLQSARKAEGLRTN